MEDDQTLLPLQSATFSDESIDAHGMGGGVVPFAVTPEGDVRLLLGRERWINSWRGSCRWSGFEGSRKDGESLQDTSVREFVEESLGVVLDARSTRRRFRMGDYWVRVVLRIGNDRRAERYHTTYAMRVPWDPDLPAAFHKLRLQIEHVDRLVQEFRHQRPLVIGDDADVGAIEDDADCVHVWRTVDDAPCILTPPWRYDPDHSERVTATFYEREATQLREWEVLRARLERALATCSHDSLHVRRDATWGRVQDVRLNRDHLEKDQVRWWSLADLGQVLHSRGQLGPERFRPYFLPVLQTLLDQFATSPPSGIAPIAVLAPRPVEPVREEDECQPCDDDDDGRGQQDEGGAPAPSPDPCPQTAPLVGEPKAADPLPSAAHPPVPAPPGL